MKLCIHLLKDKILLLLVLNLYSDSFGHGVAPCFEHTLNNKRGGSLLTVATGTTKLKEPPCLFFSSEVPIAWMSSHSECFKQAAR